MTIRSTVNQGRMSNQKYYEDMTTRTNSKIRPWGQSREMVDVAGANTEKRDADARVLNQSTTPGNRHNGPVE